ncbi:phosphoribosyltransferase family protein [Vibrio sp. RC27]
MLAEKLKNAITPYLHRLCNTCELPLNLDEEVWCNYCSRHFLFPPCCQCCGLPLPKSQPHCGECLSHPPNWQRLYCLGDYQFPISQEIHKIKYQRQDWRLPRLVNKLVPIIDDIPEMITSVPLHWRRRWHRGFNQSELMASRMASQLNTHYQPNIFKRIKATPFQRGLNRRQRQQNMKRAFVLQPHQLRSCEHIAICDDVVTTGSTVNQLCNLLLDAGIKRVDIYCLCRTASNGLD